MPEECWNASESSDLLEKKKKEKKGHDFQIPFGKDIKPKDIPRNKSNIKNMPTVLYAPLQMDLGGQLGLLGLSLACLCVSSHLDDEHSRALHWAQPGTKQFASLRWATKPTALSIHSCPETALPVLPPGQSISAEFGASSRGRERARKSSPTRQKTREGALEWKDERTKRSYNKTQTEPQTVRTLHSGAICFVETQLQKPCCLNSSLPIRTELISGAWKGSTDIYKGFLSQWQVSVPPIQLWKSPVPSSQLSLLPGIGESHHVQSWGTEQSEIQFSWLFFTWIQLPIGFMRHSQECLYWNTLGGNWR